MKILVFGGTGFVGLNIAAALLARGHAVTLFDRAGLPPVAAKDFASHGDKLTTIQGDIRDKQAIEAAVSAGYDAIILGAAITAGPEREASDPETILVIGTGHIAAALCTCYAALMAPRRLLVWGRRPERALALADQLTGQGIAVEPATDLHAAVREADIVSAATLSRQPLIRGVDVRPGTHVDLVGGFTPAMREADDRLIGEAILVADGDGALDTAGDLAGPIARGIIDRGEVRLLADILAGRRPGRGEAGEITLFKSVGHALEDLVAMEMIVEGMAR